VLVGSGSVRQCVGVSVCTLVETGFWARKSEALYQCVGASSGGWVDGSVG